MRKLMLGWLALAGSACFAQGIGRQGIYEKTLATPPRFLWPATAEQAAHAKIKPAAILSLMHSLYPEGGPIEVSKVQSFRFAPLEKNKVHLIAVVDETGDGDFGVIEMIRCIGKKCSMTRDVSFGDNDLSKQVVDVDGDGVFEIITRDLAGGYEGAATRPIYTYAIRRLKGDDLVDVSSQYPKYFRDHILPMMEEDRKNAEERIAGFKDLPEGEAGKRSSPEEQEEKRMQKIRDLVAAKTTIELQYVQDDYARRVKGERMAGLSHAIYWSGSPELEIARFGLKVLGEIEGPEATAAIEDLTHSANAALAKEASDALQERRAAPAAVRAK